MPSQRRTSEDPRATWGLVEAARDGDVDAFAELYRIYQPLIFNYVYRHVYNRTIAEDIASDVWVRASRYISSITWRGSDFAAWLITIAKNLIKDYLKSYRFRYEWSVDEPGGREIDPEPLIMARLESIALTAALTELAEDHRTVIVLRYLYDRPVGEIAEIMGRTSGATKALLTRAMRSLERVMQP